MTLRRFHAAQGGFTLAMAMGIMLVASIVCLAAFQAANGDLVPSGENSARKTAYAAAESGLAYYQTKLAANPDYWQKCNTGTSGSPAAPDPVNQPNVSTTARRWRTVPGSKASDPAEFSLTLVPQAGHSTCSTSNPASILSASDGTFRIKSTGRYRGEVRTIIATFRRTRFLDFLYFTDYETLDPATTTGNDDHCAQYRAARDAAGGCTTIQFASQDRVNGPLHTNDDLVYCGSPRFGRSSADKIHVSGPNPGYRRNSGCNSSGTPDFDGTFAFGQRALQMPPTNAALKTLVTPGLDGQGYLLTGTHYIRFTGTTMVVDTPTTSPQTVSLPPNGVIYVQDGGCSGGTSPINTNYTDGNGCANVYVSGNASRSVTVASERDIIVAPTTTSGNFTPSTAGTGFSDANLTAGTLNSTTHQVSGDVQIGLIATGFVRVYHRISNGNLATNVRNVRIDAAILSLQHSFIVDNYDDAPSPGSLSVHGAIAQRFRGPVGTGSGTSISTGYVKDYWYDDRLKYKSPPYFLDPVNAAWTIGRQNEIVGTGRPAL